MIHGLGLFAAEAIPKGTVIWTFHQGVDLMLSAAVAKALPPPARDFVLKYGYTDKESREKTFILCSDDARFFNHSETPNVISEWSPDGRYVAEVSAIDIEAGDELTCDYRAFDADPFLGFGG